MEKKQLQVWAHDRYLAGRSEYDCTFSVATMSTFSKRPLLHVTPLHVARKWL